MAIPRGLTRRIRIRRAILMLGSATAVLAIVAGVLWIAPIGTTSDEAPAEKNKGEEAEKHEGEKADKNEREEPVACFSLRRPGNACPGVRLSIKLPKRQIRSGDSIRGRLLFTNNRDEAVYINVATSPVGGTFHNIETGRRVGGFEEALVGTGWNGTVKSGDTDGMPLVVTAIRGWPSPFPSESPLPPGRYELRATARSCNPWEGGGCRPLPYAATHIRVKQAADN